MGPLISVVIPALNAGQTLAGCLAAIQSQRFPEEGYEIIVVDNGSTDNTAEIARQFNVRLVYEPRPGGAFARNAGFRVCQGELIVSTDADCVPTRNWLRYLHQAVQNTYPVVGAAGKIVGMPSESPIANFIEAIGGINTEKHLAHPTFAYAPLGNVMYSREALFAAGGIDQRYSHYPGPDLHHRICQNTKGPFIYEPRAVVFHYHPDNFRWYFNQQIRYGSGYAQLFLDYKDKLSWTLIQEARAWVTVLQKLLPLLISPSGQAAVFRRGLFLKALGHRLGFVRTFYSVKSRRRWAAPQAEREKGCLAR